MRTCKWAILLVLFNINATGCVVNRAISASAVGDNLAIEKAQNEMLLLNVIRAKDREPMYVTSLSSVTGSVKAEAVLGGMVPIGSFGYEHGMNGEVASPTHFIASPMATYNWNPTFTVNALDTSDFMRGFLAPMSSDTFAFYWNQGFPPSLLFNLMVKKVSVKAKLRICNPGVVVDPKMPNVEEYIFDNYPDSADEKLTELQRFNDWVKEFVGSNPHVAEGEKESIGPPLEEGDAVKKDLVAALKEGFTLVKEEKSKTYHLQRLSSPPVLMVDSSQLETLFNDAHDIPFYDEGRDFHDHFEAYSQEGDRCLNTGDPQVSTNTSSPSNSGKQEAKKDPVTDQANETSKIPSSVLRSTAPEGLLTLTQSGSFMLKGKGRTVPTLVKAKITITFELRSPQSMLYYLGELARVEESTKRVQYLCIQKKSQHIFVVRKEGECGREVRRSVEVSIHGISFSIPGPGSPTALAAEGTQSCEEGHQDVKAVSCEPGRSMQALSVISQVIGLQKSAKDLPGTSLVRVVGQ